jgi:mono/diheme cytochrome c family protein
MRIILVLAGLALAGCMPAPEERGALLYARYCAACHGPTGKGDGPWAGDLMVAPPDLSRLAIRNGGDFPAGDVMAQVHGYPGRFHEMPEFGAVLTGPTVIWTDAEGRRIETPRALLALARYLEEIQVNDGTKE